MMGAGDLSELLAADFVAALVFYLPFIFIMVFVVFNMTIAIIIDGYEAKNHNRTRTLNTCTCIMHVHIQIGQCTKYSRVS